MAISPATWEYHVNEALVVIVSAWSDERKERTIIDGVRFELDGETSVIDAIVEALDRVAAMLLELPGWPESVTAEVSADSDEGIPLTVEAELTLEHPNESSEVDESSIFRQTDSQTYYLRAWKWTKPTLFERKLLRWLEIAFPTVSFSYKGDSIHFCCAEHRGDLFTMLDERSEFGSLRRNRDPVASQAQRSRPIQQYRCAREFIAQTTDMLASEIPGLKEPQRKVRLREFRTW
jgi:hypothetical protein